MESQTIEIQIFGDVSLNGLFCAPQYHSGLQSSLKQLDTKLGRGDLRIINWEAPITKVGKFNPAKQSAIATTVASAAIFCEAFPVDIAALANNHVGDCLYEGLKTTFDFLETKNIKTTGASTTLDIPDEAILLEIGGVQIGIINFVGK